MVDRADYIALVKSRPELFTNPSGAAFKIILDEAGILQAELDKATELEAMGLPRGWSTVGVAFRDQYVLLLRDAVRYADGSLGTYIRTVNQAYDGVVILPMWQHQILLIRHFRHATRRWHLEIPRGFGSNADAEESARRELEEEIEAVGIRLINLGHVYPDSGSENSRVALYFAEVTAYGQPESNEGINDIIPTPVPLLEHMIRHDLINDSFLLAAYARAKVSNLI
jgi:ADP-ribose pyrophosphatase